MLHASTVALDGRAVLISGASGSGKSDLALRLIDRGFTLVSDDQTMVRREGGGLIASAPPNIAGKLEIRGLGIVEVDYVDSAAVSLAVALSSDIKRLPDGDELRTIIGVAIPLVEIDATPASAALKVAIALDRIGLQAG